MVKLRRIAVLPVAKIFTVLHAVIGLLLGLIVTVGSIVGEQDEGLWSLGAWSLLVFPFVNAGLGFLTGTFLAGSYNLFARWTGGIEFELENKSSAII